MPNVPNGRSLLAIFWPEAAALGVGLVLLGPLHVPEVAATVLALAGYGTFRLINRTAQQSDLTTEPTLKELMRQLTPYQHNPKIAPFQANLAELIALINREMSGGPISDAGLKELTRQTVSETLRITQNMAQLAQIPDPGDPVFRNYRNLLAKTTSELKTSYAAATLRDNSALANQIETSSQQLQILHNELRNEDI